MFTKKHYINITALFLAALINSFFLYKIASMFSERAFFYSVLYLLAFCIIAFFAGNKLNFAGKTATIRIVLLILSPAVYHLAYTDFRTLSTGLILILMQLVSEKYVDPTKKDIRFLVFGFLFGLLLSESYSAILIYIVFVLYFFRFSFPAMGMFAAVSIITFCLLRLVNLPAGTDSLAYVMQSFILSLPLWSKILLIVIAVYLGWIAADIQEVVFAGALLTLFLALSLTVNGLYDIIYYSLAAIFSIFSLKNYKVDRYLGKVLEPEEGSNIEQ